jgi:hypothetical protein
MKSDTSITTVREIMLEFAALTGLAPVMETPRRYLWTDAFAVCNYLELYCQTGDVRYRHLALSLVDQVHSTLGRHRADDMRTGWISGRSEQDGKEHPTMGGLRIGKKMNERRPSEALDDELEWDRDGQYYHYLTKWMHALNRVCRVTADPVYNTWAIELAKTAHARFTYVPPSGGPKRMYWKMSIDLAYPLVGSMGHHDPLEGLITYHELQATAEHFKQAFRQDLTPEIADMTGICEGINWDTDDPLGIGGLLCSAYAVAQLSAVAVLGHVDLLDLLLDSSLRGLRFYARENPLGVPARYRLAFRELGLSIGLRAAQRIQDVIERNPHRFNRRRLHPRMAPLLEYAPLGREIEAFWLEPGQRKSVPWREHREINLVMLATSLAPDGYLTL